jgi:hypothetical protein
MFATPAADYQNFHGIPLMSEMSHSRKYHSEAVFVRRGNDLVVAH